MRSTNQITAGKLEAILRPFVTPQLRHPERSAESYTHLAMSINL